MSKNDPVTYFYLKIKSRTTIMLGEKYFLSKNCPVIYFYL